MIITNEKKYSNEWDVRNEYNELNNKTIKDLNNNLKYKKYEEILKNYFKNEIIDYKPECIIY